MLRASGWTERVVRPLVAALLIGAVVLSLVAFAQLLLPGWRGRYLVPFCALVALEAQYSYWLFRYGPLRLADTLRGRAIEAGLLYLALRIAGNVSAGRTNPLAGLSSVDGGTVVACTLVLCCWLAGWDIAHELDRLGEPPGLDSEYTSAAERLAGRFFQGGAVLLVAAGLTRVGFADLLNLSRASVAGPLLNVLVYFLLGAVMLGQLRYTTLRHRWRQQRLVVAAGLAGRWLRYSLAFLTLVAILALVLPTSFTVGLLDMLRLLVSLVITLLGLLAYATLAALAWLISPFFPDLAGGLPPPPPPPPPPSAPEGAGGGNWIEVLKSLLFWGVVLAGVAYFVHGYLRSHPRVGQFLGRLAPLRLLRRWGAAWWRRLRGYALAVGERLPRRLPSRLRGRVSAPGRPRAFHLGALSPRERVLYYYLSIVRRAAGQGLPRRATQTPSEYAATLGAKVPEAGHDLSALTRAFLEARYSRHEIGAEGVVRARGHWQRVKAALQALRRRSESGAPVADTDGAG